MKQDTITQAHHAYVAGQYGTRANAYVESRVHASGADLDQVEAFVRLRPRAQLLDLGCGGGHVTYRVAPHVGNVIACDITAEMVDVVAANAAARGLGNVTTEQGAAEALPFEDESFDLIICRFSAHHWHDFEAGLREARRVLRHKGRALFIDAVSPQAALLDTHLQTLELLRDTSHVRDYTPAEWIAALARARFDLVGATPRVLRMEFPSWVERTRTSPEHVAALQSLQKGAADEVKTHFGVGQDGSFDLTVLAFEVMPA